MSIILTCTLAAGFLFTPPDGYVLTKVQGPPWAVQESRGTSDTGPGMPAHLCVCDGAQTRTTVTLVLQPTQPGTDTLVLPEGCTGEATGVKFEHRTKDK